MEKAMEEYERIVEETHALINQYREVSPDYVVRYEMDGFSHKVRGHKESPILFCDVATAEGTCSYVMSYQDESPMQIKRLSEHTVEILYGGFDLAGVHITMENLRQEGETFSFVMKVNEKHVGHFSIESPHFAHVDIVGALGSNAKVVWGPIVRAALKYVVIPLATSVAGGLLANSCSNESNDNKNAAAECHETMRAGIEACRELKKIPYVKHGGENHNGCLVTCLPAE